jgi:pilus assembly protein CpaB
MESVNKKVILIAIFMALVTTMLVYFYISNSTTTHEAAVPKISVFVASKTLPPKHKITQGDIRQERVAKEYLNSKAVQSENEILGKLVKDTIIEGEQILKDRLVSDNKNDLVYNVPEGKRAVSMNVNEQIEVSNLLRPGDYVDIIASFEKEEVEDAANKIVYPRMSKIVLQNILVLALGQDQTIPENKTPEIPRTVTLAVTPEEAEKLVYITEYATVRMALRPVGDSDNVNTQGTTRNDLVTGRNSKTIPYTQDRASSP